MRDDRLGSIQVATGRDRRTAGDRWRLCRCGHLMLLHDVEDMEGNDPLCCVEGCDQHGCRE